MSHRSIVASLVASGAVLVCFFGCSAAGSDADLGGSDAPPQSTSSLPPPSGASSSGDMPSDGGSGGPTKHDASVDAGPPPPAPGDACTKVDAIYSRSCGACGKQEAICQAPDGGSPSVSAYSACHDELAGGCMPGAVATESCGNCGTHTKTCSKYCAWSVSACTGEPLDSCPAGTTLWTSAGCPTTGTFRSRACSDACSWQSYSACSTPDYQVHAPKTLGATSRVIIPLSSAYKSKRVMGTCGSATLSATAAYAVAWVRVVNDGDKTATLSIWNEAPTGSPVVRTVLASYAAQPSSDPELTACEKGTSTFCPASIPCGDPSFGALTGTNAVVIAPGQSKIVGITGQAALGTAGEISEGSVTLAVRPDSLD